MPRPKKTPSKQEVWNGRYHRIAKGTLEPLILEGVQPTYSNDTSFIDGKPLKNAPVQLFNSGRLWWLNYGKDYNTGSFDSKKRSNSLVDSRRTLVLVDV